VTLAPNPTVTIEIPDVSALRFFVPPDIEQAGRGLRGRPHTGGRIVHELFRLRAASLSHDVAARTSAGFRLLRRHSKAADRRAIQYHYDVSNEFYSLFLDARHGLFLRVLPQRGRLARAGAGAEARPHPHKLMV
jgi:hypothetical protein